MDADWKRQEKHYSKNQPISECIEGNNSDQTINYWNTTVQEDWR